RGKNELAPGAIAQRRPDPPLGETESVVRSGVEVADATVPGGGQAGRGLLVAAGLPEIPRGRPAEADHGDLQRGPGETARRQAMRTRLAHRITSRCAWIVRAGRSVSRRWPVRPRAGGGPAGGR